MHFSRKKSLNFRTRSLFLLTFALCSFDLSSQQSKPLTRIEFVFDASFSMFGQWQSGMKMDIAKKMLTEFLDSLKNVKNLEIAFRPYGHQVPLRPERSCTDTKLEVPFGPDIKTNITAIKNKLRMIVPKGTTPIAYTLEQCGGDFPVASNPGIRNIIILITDGLEECDGDPCAVSLALQKKGIILKPFVIGIGLDQSFLNAFGCIGKFYDASNEASFKNILNIVISQALNNTSVQVNLNDQVNRPTETDVNMTFYDEGTGIIRYNYMHTINHKGVPDTLTIDPIGTYKMVVHTIPPVEKTGIELVPGKHNIIAVDAPQGYLNLKVTGANPATIIRKNADMQTLHIQQFNTTEKYIVGKYDLEILTLPRIRLSKVDIAQSKTTTIEIPQSGSVTIAKPGEGPGSLYVEENNKMVWVCNLNPNAFQETITLQPGRYRVEYRPKNAKESIYTIEKKFKIESGTSTPVKLY
ncbi:MAG: Mg-chelatase subunit ChlD [Bacteroidota bacterium]|jgi:Ca-activated chloride channel family protein|nr:Mg-chelatase subunit ChlD [Bacteroidota bacterium]